MKVLVKFATFETMEMDANSHEEAKEKYMLMAKEFDNWSKYPISVESIEPMPVIALPHLTSAA